MILRIALCQVNPKVGDLEGNARKILFFIEEAKKAQAHLVVFPELVLSGYPPEDLLFNKAFLQEQDKWLSKIAPRVDEELCLVGCAFTRKGKRYNGCACLNKRRVVIEATKTFLPNYGVFDEKRYFSPGERLTMLDYQGYTIGVSICEDIWEEGVVETQGWLGGCELVVNLSSSPYHRGKGHIRRELIMTKAKKILGFVAYVNLVGGQDELVFDGRSLIASPKGELIAEGKAFEEDLLLEDLSLNEARALRHNDEAFQKRKEATQPVLPFNLEKVVLHTRKLKPLKKRKLTPLSPEEKVYRALQLGCKDYVEKNGFERVIIGISGGIDSALVATIAVDALGASRVHSLLMPSRFTSPQSIEDAKALVKALGITWEEIPIDPILEVYLKVLKPFFKEKGWDVTEENLQARIRGNLLMAFSNKFGYLVLTTGNKSEISVGYCTLYGDTAGGFAVIKDLPKTWVYALCRWRNQKEGREIIPTSILTKPPSAELKPNQKDQDTLPPYEMLDAILERYVERDMGFQEILQEGFDPLVVKRVLWMVDKAEYKRRQSPPGIKITPRAFGKDRRMPITNGYDPTKA